MKKWRKHNQNDNEVMSQYHIQTKQFFVKILTMPSSLSAVPPTSDQSLLPVSAILEQSLEFATSEHSFEGKLSSLTRGRVIAQTAESFLFSFWLP